MKDGEQVRGRAGMEPAIPIGLLALACGGLCAFLFGGPGQVVLPFLLGTLAALPTLALAYAAAARVAGWRRINLETLLNWLLTLA